MKPQVKVNGEPLSNRGGRPKVDKRRYNHDLHWLINESRGELGEQGMAIDPSGGGGSRNPANNWPAIPSTKTIGANTQIVVMVLATTA